MLHTAQESLELPVLLDILKRYLAGPLGEWQLEEFRESCTRSSRREAVETLAAVDEAMQILARSGGEDKTRGGGEGGDRETGGGESGGREAGAGDVILPRFRGLRDMREAVDRLRAEGVVLEGQQIHGIIELLDRAQETRLRLRACTRKSSRLAGYARRLGDFTVLLRQLSGKVLGNGELADDASPELGKIRHRIERQRQAVHTTLEQFVRKHYDEGVLQEDYVTIRNGRLIVPVKSSRKWRVEGVVHGTSSTGQTIFVEPVASIELNNQIVELLEQEQIEIHRILREMTQRLRGEREAIAAALLTLAQLELLFAKARFGAGFGCSIPSFNDEGVFELRLKNARHPLLMDVLSGQGRSITPLSLTLNRDRRVLLISGPNAGGKTVVLKTVGLLTLMARAGLPVPADEAEFPWFDRVLADIGDSQSIAESLSTFSAHVEKLKRMLEQSQARSLVLLDELGAATDPEEGGALGTAVVDHFLQTGGFTIASTHLPALKVYAATTSGVENAAVGFDEETLAPNYKLLLGVPGQSAGLAMAERLGIPVAVIVRARQAMSTHAEDTVAFLRQLHQKVREMEEAQQHYRQAERSFRERESELALESKKRLASKIKGLERDVERHIQRFESESRQMLAQLAETGGSRRAQTSARKAVRGMQRELRAELQAVTGQQPSSMTAPAGLVLEAGAMVRLGTLNATGCILREMTGEQWEVEVGQLRLRVSREEIAEVLPPAAAVPAKLSSGITFHAAVKTKTPESLSEVNVIGHDAESARSVVDKFLDDAVLAQIQRLRIIHGHGMNVLRNTLWKMFADHPHVERFYQAEQREGGGGATIVEVRL